MESNLIVPKTLRETTLSQQRDPDGVYKVKVRFRSSTSVTSRSADDSAQWEGVGASFLKNVTCIVDELESRASSTSKNVLRHSLLSINQPILCIHHS